MYRTRLTALSVRLNEIIIFSNYMQNFVFPLSEEKEGDINWICYVADENGLLKSYSRHLEPEYGLK